MSFGLKEPQWVCLGLIYHTGSKLFMSTMITEHVFMSQGVIIIRKQQPRPNKPMNQTPTNSKLHKDLSFSIP